MQEKLENIFFSFEIMEEKNMYHRIEFWRSLPSLSLAITTLYWVWICFMAHLLSLLLIPKSFLNFWLLFYWLGKNFFCSQKKPYGDSFIDWWCWLSKIYKNISQKCEIFFWNLWQRPCDGKFELLLMFQPIRTLNKQICICYTNII